jgi:hypothetical protein
VSEFGPTSVVFLLKLKLAVELKFALMSGWFKSKPSSQIAIVIPEKNGKFGFVRVGALEVTCKKKRLITIVKHNNRSSFRELYRERVETKFSLKRTFAVITLAPSSKNINTNMFRSRWLQMPL